MLELTPLAASAIANECAQRALPETGGIRIYPRRTKKEKGVRALVVEFVAQPEDHDTVIREGDAAVFLADGVERIVDSRLLDAESAGSPPQLVLRSRNGNGNGNGNGAAARE
jgi:hypothetical protein